MDRQMDRWTIGLAINYMEQSRALIITTYLEESIFVICVKNLSSVFFIISTQSLFGEGMVAVIIFHQNNDWN